MTDEQKQLLEQHLAWLSQFAADDDDFQRDNWRDNMASIRAQIERMRRDFGIGIKRRRAP